MPAIVEQLQTDALNTDISVSTLLRKMKLAAVKLKLPKIEEWVEQEQKGYHGALPDYRITIGKPKTASPVAGWIPIQGPAPFMAIISEARIAQSISSIENNLENPEMGSFYLPYLPHQVSDLQRRMNVRWEMALELHRSQLAEIVDRVRNQVFEWALELERQGILGTEVGFDEKEKALANDRQVNIHIGSIGALQGAISSEVSGENSRLNIGSDDKSSNNS